MTLLKATLMVANWRDVEGTSVGVDLRTLKKRVSVVEEGE